MASRCDRVGTLRVLEVHSIRPVTSLGRWSDAVRGALEQIRPPMSALWRVVYLRWCTRECLTFSRNATPYERHLLFPWDKRRESEPSGSSTFRPVVYRHGRHERRECQAPDSLLLEQDSAFGGHFSSFDPISGQKHRLSSRFFCASELGSLLLASPDRQRQCARLNPGTAELRRRGYSLLMC